MEIKINLEREGLYCIFKEYQIAIMDYLWSQTEPKRSLEVWESIGPEGISRASVINSLHWLTNLGILSRTTVTGKGGHRGLFTAEKTQNEILILVREAAYEKLDYGIKHP